MLSPRTLFPPAVLGLLLVASPSHADTPEPAPRWRSAVHAGWWDVGADLTTPCGLFLGLGVPWVPLLPFFAYSGQDGILALDSRLGYAHAFDSRTRLSAHLLTAWVYDWGDPCGDGCSVHTHRLFFLPGLGLRHRFTQGSGWMIGADLSLLVLQVHHDDEADDSGWRRKDTPAWLGAAFSQAYVGYEWSL
jgi:hypothetical protein